MDELDELDEIKISDERVSKDCVKFHIQCRNFNGADVSLLYCGDILIPLQMYVFVMFRVAIEYQRTNKEKIGTIEEHMDENNYIRYGSSLSLNPFICPEIDVDRNKYCFQDLATLMNQDNVEIYHQLIKHIEESWQGVLKHLQEMNMQVEEFREKNAGMNPILCLLLTTEDVKIFFKLKKIYDDDIVYKKCISFITGVICCKKPLIMDINNILEEWFKMFTTLYDRTLNDEYETIEGRCVFYPYLLQCICSDIYGLIVTVKEFSLFLKQHDYTTDATIEGVSPNTKKDSEEPVDDSLDRKLEMFLKLSLDRKRQKN
jgi:hypothetical protein